MTKMQKPTFLVQRGSAARLIAAIALATFGCANYVQAAGDPCNQTYDDVASGDTSCMDKGTTSVVKHYTSTTIRQCRESKFLYTNQRCAMGPYSLSVVTETFNGSICAGHEIALAFTNEQTTSAILTSCS